MIVIEPSKITTYKILGEIYYMPILGQSYTLNRPTVGIYDI